MLREWQDDWRGISVQLCVLEAKQKSLREMSVLIHMPACHISVQTFNHVTVYNLTLTSAAEKVA